MMPLHARLRFSMAAASTAIGAMVAACGGGSDGPTGPEPARPPSQTGADKRLPYWAGDTDVRPNLAHLVGKQPAVAPVITLDAAEAAQVRRAKASGQPLGRADGTGRPRALAFATQRRTIAGLSSVIYHTTNGSEQFSNIGRTTEALVPDALGGYERIPATTQGEDGFYTIANVPDGPHWVRLNDNFVWTDAAFVDWTIDSFGRADFSFAGLPTSITIDADNLSPWQPGDALTWVVPMHGESWPLPLGSSATTNAPQAGDTALRGFTLHMNSDSLLLGLLDASRGDQAYLNQLVSQPTTGVRALARSVILPGLVTPDGSSTPVSTRFVDIAPSAALTLRWDRSAYLAHAAAVHPSAVVSDTGMGVSAFALPPRYGTPFDAYTLMEYNTFGTDDVDFGRIGYGDPFPADWNRVLDSFVIFSMRYLAPGATQPAVLQRGMASSELVDPAARDDTTVHLTPRVTPPRSARINGRSLFNNQLAVGTSPTLTWSSPAVGQPNQYFVRLMELAANGPQSSLLTRARFYTTSATLTIPPGLMQAGHLYVFTVAATEMGSPITEPMRGALPHAFGTLMSGIVSP